MNPKPKRRRLGEWHRSRVLNQYAKDGSVAQAAKAAGVSLPSAYRIVEAAKVYRSAVPVFPIRLERRAVELYLAGLSCRKVAAALALEMTPAPSQQWVFERVRDAGRLRNKSESDRLMNQALTGLDYDAISRRAIQMVVVERRSVRETARLLGVSCGVVKRAAGDATPGPSEATRRRAWESPHSKSRLDRLALARALRVSGLTQGQIATRLGVGLSTVFKDL